MTFDPAEIHTWNARQKRAREEYRERPATFHGTSGPCLTCGQQTRNLSGICRDCEEDA